MTSLVGALLLAAVSGTVFDDAEADGRTSVTRTATGRSISGGFLWSGMPQAPP
jgi:hypothetical protein